MPLVLQDRDIGLLRDLFESRVMTLRQAAAIHFDGRQEAAKKRVQRLKAEKLVRERARRIGESSVLYLGRRGFEQLISEGLLEGYPRMSMQAMERRSQVSPLTIRHELEVMDIKAAFVTAVRARLDLRLISFSTWPALNEFKTLQSGTDPYENVETTVKPDAFVRLWEDTRHGTHEHSFYLEADRSTESLEVLARRAAAYANFYRSGGFAERMGGDRTQRAAYPFRVLMTFKSEARKRNIAMKLRNVRPPIRTQVLLAAHHGLMVEPLGQIWQQPDSVLDAASAVTLLPT